MADHNRLTQKEIDEICLVYTKTNNEKETAKITHHSSTTISKYLKINGLARGRGGNQDKQRKIKDEESLLDIELGLTRQEIAKKHEMYGYVSAEGLTSNPDNLHFCAKALREFGIRYYQEFKKLERPDKVFFEKPEADAAIKSAMELL